MFATATAVTWLSARQAILFIAPVMVYSLAACAMLAAVVATIAFCVDRSEWLATRRTEARRDRALAKNEARQSDIASDRAQMQLMAEGRMMAATVRQMERGMIHPAALGDGKFSSFPTQVINQIEQAVPLLEAPAQPLLPAIRDCDNVLIVGGKGSGKTTLLQWLESERLQSGQTIALDSHAVPGQWAGQYIGAGRKYAMIKNAMIALVDKMDRRHRQRTDGQQNFEPVHTMIDEFTLLPGYLKKADYEVQNYSFPMLTEGRKVEMTCLWGSHSDRAKPLGFEGMADLKECFDCIVYLKQVRGEFYALVDFGEGKENTRYALPGPFVSQSANTVPSLPETTTETATIDELEFVVTEPSPGPARPTPSEGEMAAIEAFVSVRDNGETFYWKDATQLAFGAGKFGKNYTNKLKRILDKFAIDYSKQEVKK